MKILIADDHTIVREGVRMVLKEAYPFAEITEVSDSVSLLKQVTHETWDVIICDISMPPGDSGLDALIKIKQHAPHTPVIILSMHAADQYAVRAIKAGASAYLNKGTATRELVKAVNQVLSGKRYLSPEVADILADACEHGNKGHTIDALSNRELEVFKLLASGKSVSEAAKELFLNTNTISTFRARIFEKMGFANIMELIKYAVDQRLA
ncbi:MAG: response regulator transcription factor [Sediminibacterium sp.]